MQTLTMPFTTTKQLRQAVASNMGRRFYVSIERGKCAILCRKCKVVWQIPVRIKNYKPSDVDWLREHRCPQKTDSAVAHD
jgi:hypothetical protein